MNFKQKEFWILLGILILAAILRTYKLGSIPHGLSGDEVISGYQVFSLKETGKDEWGVKWPLVFFKGYGDYRLVLNNYITLLLSYLMPLDEMAIRLPSAMAGVAAVWLTYLLVLVLSRNKRLALLSALLLSISPYHIGLSRHLTEGLIASTLFIAGIYFFVRSLNNQGHFLWSAFFWALSFYTHYNSRLFLPFLWIGLIIFFFRQILVNAKKITVGLVVFIILIIPLMPSFFSTAGSARLRQSAFKTDEQTSETNLSRSICRQYLSENICRLFYNRLTIYFGWYSGNYLSNFSPSMWFINGTFYNFNYLFKRGLLYVFELIPLTWGFLTIIRDKKLRFIAYWLLLTPLTCSLSGIAYLTRLSLGFPAWHVTIAVGLWSILTGISQVNYRRICSGLIAGCYLLGITRFAFDYLYIYPHNYEKFFNGAHASLFQYLLTISDKYQKILLFQIPDFPEYFYLFYSHYPPRQWHANKAVILQDNFPDFNRITRIDNWYFMENEQDIQVDENTLIVTPELSPLTGRFLDAKWHLRVFESPYQSIRINIFSHSKLD